MEFIESSIVKGEPVVNDYLLKSYKGKQLMDLLVGSKASKIQGEIILTMIYTIDFKTDKNETISRTPVVYGSAVIRQNLSEINEKIELWSHIKKGIVLALKKANGDDTKIEDEVLSEGKWNSQTEKAYNDILQAF